MLLKELKEEISEMPDDSEVVFEGVDAPFSEGYIFKALPKSNSSGDTNYCVLLAKDYEEDEDDIIF